jgi:hypothetical protein
MPIRPTTPGLFPPADASSGATPLRFKGVRPVGVLSAAGELTLRRRYYWGPGGVGGRYPSDERAGIAGSTLTPGARELCCVMGLASDFRTASASLKRVGGLSVCPERLRQVVERDAAAVTAARDAGVVAAGWSAKTDALEQGLLYVGVDGLLVRTVTQAEKDKRRKAHAARRGQRGRAGVANLKPLAEPRPGTDQAFKEVKFALFYDRPKAHRHTLATAGDGSELGRLLRRHAGSVGFDQAKHTVALTDGAPWIARQLRLNLPTLGAHVLDFYHLAQHVHAAAKQCLGEGTAAAADWAHARLGEIKRSGPVPVLAAIAALSKRVRSSVKREGLRRLRGYLCERIGMLDYPKFKRRGWDIGSGPTEAGGKDLAARLRGVGMKWDLPHAADLMNLKGLYESGQAQGFWAAQASTTCLN